MTPPLRTATSTVAATRPAVDVPQTTAPPEKKKPPPSALDRTEASRPDASKALARDPWGRPMIAQGLTFDGWVPPKVREDVKNGLPNGLHKYPSEDGREVVVWSERKNGLRTVEMYQTLPESKEYYLARNGGDSAQAGLLARSAAQYNRDLKHLVEDKGMPPGAARSELRRINDEVFKKTIEAAMVMATSGASLGMVRALPSSSATGRARPDARPEVEPGPPRTAERPTGATGPASGRPYDPARAGGPVRELSYENVKVTARGIDAVERHLRRFDPPGEAELKMVARLREIAEGRRAPEPADLRFYTHELRESVRYKRAGQPTGQPADADAAYELWNNTHTATLEDYRLKEGQGVLFAPGVK